MSEPSWWEYVGGRTADKAWAMAYTSAVRRGMAMSARERSFSLAAIDRLATDAYVDPAHRPPHRVKFWLACHYQLGVLTKSRKAAAIDSATVAARAGARRGNTPKQIQRRANELEKPVREFLDAVMQQAPLDWPPHWRQQLRHAASIHRGMIRFVEAMVQKVA